MPVKLLFLAYLSDVSNKEVEQPRQIKRTTLAPSPACDVRQKQTPLHYATPIVRKLSNIGELHRPSGDVMRQLAVRPMWPTARDACCVETQVPL